MNNTLKISEIFRSIQGEGRFQGIPATFIRLSGCTRNCSWCDTKYHKEGNYIPFKQIYGMINNNLSSTLIFTGGEPLVQWKNLKKFLNKYFPYALKTRIHLESNGDLIKKYWQFKELFDYFNYVCFSPKEEKVAKKLYEFTKQYKNQECCNKNNFVDIKIVTDLEKVGINMLNYATTLMPLTTYKKNIDKKIKQRIWRYCIFNNLFYSSRLQVEVWGKKRKV